MSVKDNLEKLTLFVVMISLVFFATGCDNEDDDFDVVFEYNFRETDGSWEPFFTGYNVGWDETMELKTDYTTLPEPLETEDYAHFISAMNRSDDVKMLFRKQVDGLEPGMNYMVSFTIRFATEVPSGCAGIGGPPGEAVRVIAAADITKPEAVTGLMGDDYYVLNLQYLSDNPGEWYQRAIMGDIANSRECEDGYEFEIKEVGSRLDHDSVTADENGRVWLLFGTRSGFEGQTDLYYTYFRAEFRRY
jgi:hypothetical protein